MKHLKIGFAATAALTAVALLTAAPTSATILEVGGVEKNESVTITSSIAAGNTAVLRDTFGFFANTCDKSHVAGKTESGFSTKPTGKISTLSFESCDHTVTVHNPGKLYVEWTSGTNGLVFSEEAEVTTYSTLHGTHINCKTGSGTPIGTLTGVAFGQATLDINATLNCGPHLSSAKWTGTYTVTSPSGLGVVKEGSEEAHPLRTTPQTLSFPTGDKKEATLVIETSGPTVVATSASFVRDKIFENPFPDMDYSLGSIQCWANRDYGSSCTATITSTASASGDGFLKIETNKTPKYVRIWHNP